MKDREWKVTFEALVTAPTEEDAVADARAMIGKPDFEPWRVVQRPLDRVEQIIEDIRVLDTILDQVIVDEGDRIHKERAGAEIYAKISNAKVQIETIVNEAKTADPSINKAIDDITALANRLLVKIFDMKPEEIEAGLQKFRSEMSADDTTGV